MPCEPSCIHWFRKGLRLHDNPALLAALEPGAAKKMLVLRPTFVLDPWFVQNGNVGANRWRFLQQSLVDLDQQLRSLGSRLFVVRGSPQEVFPDLFKQWNVAKLTYETDTEPYAAHRDQQVLELATKAKVQVVQKISHTLYDLDDVLSKNNGTPPMTYQKFTGLVSSLGHPSKPLAAPDKLPKECQLKSTTDDHMIPDLIELGVNGLEACLYPGGESEGLKRLDKYISVENGKWVRAFEKPQTSPNSLEPSTTVLSPYIKFGCVSCREMYWRLVDINKKGSHSQPPVSLVGQLYWREFFYTVGYATENFDVMNGNAICRQIPWENNREYLNKWKLGQTGYPFIDAIMTQLRKEGWIHHLARHAVACFLTRGDLWVSWEEGKKVFEEYLLDADWSLNAGNWMWLSASAFFHQYFRVYSPVAFGKKTDPKGEYIKKYLPVLKNMPEKYIYEPWTAPTTVQQAAGCIVDKDYPKPIVDHATVHKANIQKMKAAYDAGKADKEGTGSSKSKKAKRDNSDGAGKITK